MVASGLYLLLGTDRPKKLQRVQALERSLNIQPLDRHEVDGSAITSAQLLALCRQQPALSPVRLIVVDRAHRLEPPCIEQLLRQAQTLAQTACLVLLIEAELSVRHPLHGVGKPVITEHFASREAPSAKPFAMTEALGARDLGAALGAMHDQMRTGREPLELLGLVAWQVQRWLLVKRLAASGASADGISASTGLKAWQVQRLHAEVASRSLGELKQLLHRCRQLDVDAKQGRATPVMAIEQLIAEVCVRESS